MTTEIEKTFFDTLGIEQKCQNTFINPSKCPFIESRECCDCVSFEYPQISDRILLELICILSEWRQYCDSDYVIKAINIDNLKEDILKDCLYMSNWYEFKKCGKDIKHQVRTLFEEG